jgi:hypothetical protein
MPDFKPLLLRDGEIQEAASGDTIPTSIAPGSGGAGGGAQMFPATITVPWRSGGGRLDWSEVVSVVGVTATSKIAASLFATPDVDDNDVEEIGQMLVSASYFSSGQVRIDAAFPAPVTGSVNLLLTVI